MKQSERIDLRLTPKLKAQLVAEAQLASMSLNTYCLSIMTYRKRVKIAIAADEGRYLGFR